MMLRWEQLQPVNAIQVAWLNGSYSAATVCAAATRVLQRLLRLPSSVHRGIELNPDALFSFSHRLGVGDWRAHLESLVTDELNNPYLTGEPPIRITLLELRPEGQFLAFGYRHVIADARSTALVMHEIMKELSHPAGSTGATPSFPSLHVGGQSIRELFPTEYGWLPTLRFGWHLVQEWWKSQHCVRLPMIAPENDRMEFRIHQTALPMSALQEHCRRLQGTMNDLLIASILDWFARRGTSRSKRRTDLAVATLVDLCHRGAPPQPLAFGQFLSQFVVRAPVRRGASFADLVRLTAERTGPLKQVAPLVRSARGFDFLARLWDLVPAIRRPAHLPAVLPLVGGISNVNLRSIVGSEGASPVVRNYFRGTCVTNVLPMMLSLTTVRDMATLTTTHRPAYFTPQEMDDLAAHVTQRLFGEGVAAERVAA
ncbi:MAG: hypothetical protein ACKV0T_24750 [Planctomycetales bacterium]